MVDPLVRPIPVVRMADPALDMSVEERIAYAKSRDPDKIRELPGQRAIRFHVRPLTAMDGNAIDRMNAGSEQIVGAFLFGCIAVEGIDATGMSAERKMLPTRALDTAAGKRSIWSDEQMDALQDLLGRGAFYEIGTVIYERALRGKAAGGAVPFTVPQSSLDELASTERLRVERLRAEHAATAST